MNIRKCSTNIVREHSLVIPVRLRKSTSKQQKSWLKYEPKTKVDAFQWVFYRVSVFYPLKDLPPFKGKRHGKKSEIKAEGDAHIISVN